MDGMAVSFEFDPHEKSESHVRYWVSQCKHEGFSWGCDSPNEMTKLLSPEYPQGISILDQLTPEEASAVISRWVLIDGMDTPVSVSLYSSELTEELDALFDSSETPKTAGCTHQVVTENVDFFCMNLQCSDCSPIHLIGPMSTNLDCWPSSD
jgi:hypothetical protein